ncbi:hypothetical protein PHSC3_000133 [Chlamydiales bacterium STE3]|nr:hypothetical protein PHSC3_000133 [Chlamydiales bacterium STE3]
MHYGDPIADFKAHFSNFASQAESIENELKGGRLEGIKVENLKENIPLIKYQSEEAIRHLQGLQAGSQDHRRLQESLQDYISRIRNISNTIAAQSAHEVLPNELKSLFDTIKTIQAVYQDCETLRGADKPQHIYRESPSDALKKLGFFTEESFPQSPHQILEKCLEETKSTREQILEMIRTIGSKDETFIDEMHFLEEQINRLIPFFQFYSEHSDKSDEEMEVAEQAISEVNRNLLELSKKLDIDITGLNLSYTSSRNLESFKINIQRVLNFIVNSKLCQEEMHHFVDLNKNLILANFLPSLDLNNIKIETNLELLSKSSETHNGGKQIFILTYSIEGRDPLKLVLKPRIALLDKAVIDVFKEINELPEEHRSGSYLLPMYTILNPNKEEGWDYLPGMGQISIWEFIEGATVRDANARMQKDKNAMVASVNLFISRLRKERARILQPQLNRMDAILTRMGIGDLHPENIMYEPRTPQLIPIDLEALDKERSSLGTAVKKFQLTKQELECIEKFKEMVDKLPARVVIVGTMDLSLWSMSVYSDYSNIEKFVEFIKMNLAAYSMEISYEKLCSLVFRDLLNQDIPYFTVKENLLFYGLPSHDIVIAKAKKE